MGGSQGGRKRRQRAARSSNEAGQAGDSVFDALYPELLDCILRRAAVHSSRAWKRLALVNKAFQDSALRCSGTLVLRRGGLLTKGPLKLRPLQGAEACAALSKEIGARPRVSRLVLKGDVKLAAAFLPAILEFGARWISLETLQLDVHYDKTLSSALLEEVTDRCTCLRQLFLFCYPRVSYSSRPPLKLPNFAEKCPELERLVVSQGGSVNSSRPLLGLSL
ncbi:hypothetical protein KFL_003660080 [Klebsormidium nitens]|uniref:F-box domain-containing protein n=1 Tax=Klebsormidium nitens TaxID=105231 RepID=A0A1Y1IHL2_KLENI|nr:hypothetical protein KFL_003660080 [Klebsormidium nitens]|eukprot:GAQ87628.1 hypothetical protein KFL_003660080 [Klebsormidium nitens]